MPVSGEDRSACRHSRSSLWLCYGLQDVCCEAACRRDWRLPLHACLQVTQDVLYLLQRRLEIFGDLRRQDVWLGQIGGVFQGLVAEPEDV